MLRIAAFAAMAAVVKAGATELTEANFDDEVVSSGKGAFIKFLAPWSVVRRAPPPAGARPFPAGPRRALFSARSFRRRPWPYFLLAVPDTLLQR